MLTDKTSHIWLVLLVAASAFLSCARATPEASQSQFAEDKTDVVEADQTSFIETDSHLPPLAAGPLTASFLPTSPVEKGLFFEMEDLTNEHIQIQVRTAALENVFGIAFRFRFDSSLMELVSAEGLNVLDGDGATAHSVLHLRGKDELLFGSARFHTPGQWGQIQYTGVDLDGGILATLTFKLLGEGSGSIHFDPLGRDLRNADFESMDVSWVGGTVTATHSEETLAP